MIRKGYYREDEKGNPTIIAEPAKKQKTMVIFGRRYGQGNGSLFNCKRSSCNGRQGDNVLHIRGLNIIKRPERVETDKSFLGRLMSIFMPKGYKTATFKDELFGLGPKMMNRIMKQNGVLNL